jgi:hypothetical protein
MDITSLKRRRFWLLGLFSFFTMVSFSAGAVVPADLTWIGRGSTHHWSEAANWQGGKVPGPGNTAFFTEASSKDCAIDADVKVSTIIVSGYTGTITRSEGHVFAVSTWQFESLTDRLLKRGMAALEGERYQEARESFGRALLLDPGNKEARTQIQSLRNRFKNKSDELYRRGLEAVQAGKIQTAVDFWEQALGLDPDNLEARRGLERLKGQ